MKELVDKKKFIQIKINNIVFKINKKGKLKYRINNFISPNL